MNAKEDLLLCLVRSSLWGTHKDYGGWKLSHEQFTELMQLAAEQTVVGLVARGLMDAGIGLERADVLQMFGMQQGIRQRNAVMDEAVVRFCRTMAETGIRIYVMKGQTLAVMYPDAGLRQSGDIDFLCHPEDWEKAVAFVTKELGITITDHNSEKHVEWKMDGVQYEMHRKLTTFAYPKHQRFWDEVVMAEVLGSAATIEIDGSAVPVLPPTINVLYTFVHIFYHLLIEGIGLRQLCDLAVLLSRIENSKLKNQNGAGAMDGEWVDVLDRHLQGISLKRAFTGVGAVLTDYLGLPESAFPIVLTEEDHRRAPALLQNILERGNFGHNVHYVRSRGPLHGLQHLWEMGKQARAFYHYAPAEALWRIPEMFKWWGMKIGRKFKNA